MAKSLCPVCDKLIGLSQTDIPIGNLGSDGNPVGSARRWRVDMHAHRPNDAAESTICDGSGRLI